MRLRRIWNSLPTISSGAFQVSSWVRWWWARNVFCSLHAPDSSREWYGENEVAAVWLETTIRNRWWKSFGWNKSKGGLSIEGKICCKMVLCYYQQDISKHADDGYFDEIIDKSSLTVNAGNASDVVSKTWTRLDKLLGGAIYERIVLFLDEIQFLLGTHAGYEFLLFRCFCSTWLRFVRSAQVNKS